MRVCKKCTTFAGGKRRDGEKGEDSICQFADFFAAAEPYRHVFGDGLTELRSAVFIPADKPPSGIGKATVDLFAQHGWEVFELSRHGESRAHVHHIACDVTDAQSVNTAVQTALTETEHIDVVIANAGFGISGPIEFAPTADVHRQFNVNFFGALHLTQAVLPHLRKQHFGTIIYTSSVAAILSVPYQAFYSASKAAIQVVH